MKFCKCGNPLVSFFGVDYKEFACFKCGNTYEFFDSYDNYPETVNEKEIKKEMEKLKNKFMETYTKPLTQEKFRDAVQRKSEVGK